MESFYYWFGFIVFWAMLFLSVVYVVMTLFWFFYKAYQVKKFYKLMEEMDKDTLVMDDFKSNDLGVFNLDNNLKAKKALDKMKSRIDE